MPSSFHSISLLGTLRMVCCVWWTEAVQGVGLGRSWNTARKTAYTDMFRLSLIAMHCLTCSWDVGLHFTTLPGSDSDVDCICVQLNCVLSRFAVTCAHTHIYTHKAALSDTHTHVSAFAFALFSLDASAIKREQGTRSWRRKGEIHRRSTEESPQAT